MTTPDITAILRAKLAAQPLYKKYSNTVTTLITLGVNAVWILVSLGIDVPAEVTFSIAAAIQALGVVGIRLTPNGITESQVREIEAYAGRHRSADGPAT